MSIFQERMCPLCGSSGQNGGVVPDLDPTRLEKADLQKYWTGFRNKHVFFPYGRCSQCSMLYSKTYFGPEALSELYGSMAENMASAGSENTAATQKDYVSMVEPHVREAGDYLEIGPDVGVFAKECVSRNLIRQNAWLFEPNQGVWEELRAIDWLGKSVHLSAKLGKLDGVPNASIGLAVAVHVMDHLIDPVPLLETIKSKLKPNGILFIACHNEKSLLSRLLRRRWPAYCLQHPHLFNPRSLASMLERSGLEPLEIRRTTNRFSAYFLIDTFLKVTLGTSIPDIVALKKLVVRLPLGNIAAIAQV